ncbi:MAG: hypothetical protein ACK5Y2_08740 [Bdellovibrionales bacterium]
MLNVFSFLLFLGSADFASAGPIPHFSVSDSEITRMSCASLRPPTEHQIQRYLEVRMDPDEKMDQTWQGVQFRDENPYLIELFKIAHRAEYSFIKPSIPATPCSKVICTMKHLYGADESLRMLYMAAKFGLRTSRFGMTTPDNYQNWTSSELDDTLVALESLPPHVLPLKNFHLLRFRDGYTLQIYAGRSVVANARMDVFDIWKSQSREERISVILHELGHVLGTGHDDSPEWKAFPPPQISLYAQTNHFEDFAESFLAYRVAPHRLKRLHPERYQFIKDRVFSGLEFKVNQDCETPFLEALKKDDQVREARREFAQWTQTHRDVLKQEIQRQEQLGSFRQNLWSSCAQTYFEERRGGPRSETEACLANVIRRRGYHVTLRLLDQEHLLKAKKLPPGLQDFPIDRRTLQLARQDLRLQANQLLKKIYNGKPSGIGILQYVDALKESSRYGEEIKPYLSAIGLILLEAAEKQEKGSWFQKFWAPDFLKVLP